MILGVLLMSSISYAESANRYGQANRDQQLQLLQRWSIEPNFQRLPLLQALKNNRVEVDSKGNLFISQNGKLVAIEGHSVPEGNTKRVFTNNRIRTAIANTFATHQLLSPQSKVRLQGAIAMQTIANAEQLPLLIQFIDEESDEQVKEALSIAAANLQLTDPNVATRRQAIKLLANSSSPQVQDSLSKLTLEQNEPDGSVRLAAKESLEQIQQRLQWGEWLGQAFSGLSLGSILLLAALGLAITYGLLGVINMAHGEMLMIGAYSTWMVQDVMQNIAPEWIEIYPIIAIPIAFFITALIGMFLERTVIRHLYGRPLETLLATWGISLILIQLVRVVFGAQNVDVANPVWLSGGWTVLPNLTLPYNRIAVIGFAVCVLVLTWVLLNRTRLGMNIRAVTQNRNMADCCGVPTGKVDMVAFGFGSGIAGLGGVALSQLGNVGPELGQTYIIDSFLVVVLGGVGQLAGTVFSALGLGILNKLLEPQIGAVLGKIMILVLIVLFIQKRPQGLFASKERVID